MCTGSHSKMTLPARFTTEALPHMTTVVSMLAKRLEQAMIRTWKLQSSNWMHSKFVRKWETSTVCTSVTWACSTAMTEWSTAKTKSRKTWKAWSITKQPQLSLWSVRLTSSRRFTASSFSEQLWLKKMRTVTRKSLLSVTWNWRKPSLSFKDEAIKPCSLGKRFKRDDKTSRNCRMSVTKGKCSWSQKRIDFSQARMTSIQREKNWCTNELSLKKQMLLKNWLFARSMM